jgi:phosphatidylglycerol:prolipoprotein diacylglycerol transferase
MSIPFMSIRIGIDPDLATIGNFVLTWHGFLTFISVAIAVYLAVRWARKEGLVTDSAYSVAVWGVIGGIIGARALHVIDLWGDFYKYDPVRIVQIWNGGIAIYGAILGGFLFGAAYVMVRNHSRFLDGWNSVFGRIKSWRLEKAPLPSVGHAADIAAPALLIGMAIGRIGDIINGEHVAKLSNLPWAFVYSNPESPSNAVHGLRSSHPAVVYEMLLDIVVLAIIWPLRDRLRPRGMVFALYLAIYSLGKFFISFLRTGLPPMDREWAIGLNEAHFVSLVVLAITIPLLLLKAQFVRTPPATPTRSTGAGSRGR